MLGMRLSSYWSCLCLRAVGISPLALIRQAAGALQAGEGQVEEMRGDACAQPSNGV